MTQDANGYPYALVSEVQAGTLLFPDSNFAGINKGNPVFVHSDENSALYFKCEEGRYYIAGQIATSSDVDYYIGLYTTVNPNCAYQFPALLSSADTISKIKHVINTYEPDTFNDAGTIEDLVTGVLKGRLNLDTIEYTDLVALGFLENLSGITTAARGAAPTPDGDTYFMIPASLASNLPIGLIFHKLNVFTNPETEETTITVTQDTDFIKITNYQDDVQYVGVGYNPEFSTVTINGRDYLNVALAYRPSASVQYLEESYLPANPFIPTP